MLHGERFEQTLLTTYNHKTHLVGAGASRLGCGCAGVQVETQTLILWGRHDEILDPLLYAERFEQTLPTGRLVWVERCGHSPHLEQPAFVAQQVGTVRDGS